MYRRTLLRSAVAGLLATAGCLGTFDRAETPDDGTPTTSTTTRTSNDETATETDVSDLRVERVETFGYALRMNDLGTSPLHSVSAFSELAEREHGVVADAIDGTYETTETPDWLAEFLGGTPYVERDGQYYRLDHDLPTYRITAEAVPEREVDGDIASREAYREAVTHDGVVMTGLMRMAREDDGIAFTSLWPKLADFLDRYDAVRFHGEVLDFDLSIEDDGPPYTVSATRVSMADVVGESVWDVSGESAAIREVVREAGAEPGVYALDDPPAGLFEGLDSHQYASLDGTFYTTYVEKRDPLPVSLAATFEGDGSDARLRLTLRSDGEDPVKAMCGAPRPFGILRFHPAGDDGASHLLWTDAYEESSHVYTDGHRVVAVEDIGLIVDLPPGEEVGRAFTFDWGSLPTGEYVVAGDLGIGVGDGESGTFPYRVVFRVS